MKHGKRCVSILCILLCICTLNIQIFADGKAQAHNWYLKYNAPGTPPDTPDGGMFAEKYNVIALDKSGEKVVYLTFDAGYENGNVAKVLDVLKDHKAPGAFFVLPHLIKAHPELLQRMQEEGHLICNHTKSHRNMANIVNFDEFRKELTDNEDILRDEIGLTMHKYYRPPEGAYSEANLEFADRLGFRTVFWSLAYADWDNKRQMPKEKALSLLLSRVHPGAVILLHPTSDTNAAILGDFLTELQARGYSFGSLDAFPKREAAS